jgi:hypothetical protein
MMPAQLRFHLLGNSGLYTLDAQIILRNAATT